MFLFINGKFNKMNETLKIIQHIPEGFLNVKPREITELIPYPTIIRLKGETEPPLFMSLLLHGNEFSGLIILQEILKKFRKRLPRSLTVFIGNPKACAQGVRHLEDQPDFNRIWKEEKYPLAKSVLQYVREREIYAAVDIHNNTGENPLYGCISQKSIELIKLAQDFSKDIIYFTRPNTVLSIALSSQAPSLVIECGIPGDPRGIEKGVKFIESLLSGKEKWKEEDIKVPHIYSTYASLFIDADSTVSFDLQSSLKNSHFCLTDQLDQFNFKEIPSGTVLGRVSEPDRIKLIDNSGINVFNQYFSIVENNWIVKNSFIPSMFTKEDRIAKSDCLGYVMQRIPIAEFLSQ